MPNPCAGTWKTISAIPSTRRHRSLRASRRGWPRSARGCFINSSRWIAGTQRLWDKMADRLSDCRIEITTGVQEATALPWELLRDPLTETPLALGAAAFVRSQTETTRRMAVPQLKRGQPIRILLAICRPGGGDDVPFRSVARRLLESLTGEAAALFELDVLRPPSYAAVGEDAARGQDRGQALPHPPLRRPRRLRRARRRWRRQLSPLRAALRRQPPRQTRPSALREPGPARQRRIRPRPRAGRPAGRDRRPRPRPQRLPLGPRGGPIPSPQSPIPNLRHPLPGPRVRLPGPGGRGRGRAGGDRDALQRLRGHSGAVRGRPVRGAGAGRCAGRGGHLCAQAVGGPAHPPRDRRPHRAAGLARAGGLRGRGAGVVPARPAGRGAAYRRGR